MLKAELTQNTQFEICKSPKRLLLVGPKPPPIGGSGLTVEAIIDELKNTNVQIILINTSPSTDQGKNMNGFKAEKIKRMIFILSKYATEIRNCDAVLVYGNNLFWFTMGSILLRFAKYLHKPFFVKPVGGDLDVYMENQRQPFRKYMVKVLRNTDGIFAQSRLLQVALSKLSCTNVHYLPGFRPKPKIPQMPSNNQNGIRLIFLGHIMRQKGPLVLLDSMELLEQENNSKVSCDFYGPIHDEIRQEFMVKLDAVPNSRYCGIAEAGTGAQLIAGYDVLVLPSYFECEGHPGVIIEAMHMGVPVISTQHRAIPELITSGENGLLVPPLDSQALYEAIKQLELNRPLRDKMGLENIRRGKDFLAEVVVSKMVKMIFPE